MTRPPARDGLDENSVFGSADLDKSIFGRRGDATELQPAPDESSILWSNFVDEGRQHEVAHGPVAVLRVLQPGSPPLDVVLVPGEFTIGRGDADLQLKDKSVSRRHLVLRVDHAQIVATDLGSSRGTLVGHARLRAPAPIAIGATLTLGDVRIEVRPPAAPSPAAGLAPASVLAAHESFALGAPTAVDLEEAARSSVLFDLDDQDRHALLASTQRLELAPGQVLVRPGEPLAHLWIVLSGTLDVHRDGRSTGSLAKGESLELLGVLRAAPASVEARTLDGATVLRIDAQALRSLVQRSPHVGAYLERPLDWPGAARLRQLLRDYGVARGCAIDMIAAMELRRVTAGTEIAVEGQRVADLQIINSGTVSASRAVDGAPALVAQLGEGGLIGGAEMASGRGYDLSYEASTELELISIARDSVLAALGSSPELATLLEAFGPLGQRSALQAPRRQLDDHPDDEDLEAPPLAAFRRKSTRRTWRRARPRHVRQHDEMDCGAACLAMVSQAYGRNISLATFRSRVHVTREGASMWSLVRAARQSGFETLGVQCRIEHLADLHLPAIALTKYHFVVVFKATKHHVLIGDPATGLVRVPIAQFKAEFSGMLLLLRPTARFDAQPASTPSYRKYFALARGNVRPALEIILASFLLFTFGLVAPLLSQTAFDRVIVNGDRDLLTILVVAMGAVAVLSSLIGGVRMYLSGFIANRFDTVFSALVYRWVMRLPLNFFMVRRVGDILTRFREVQTIRQFFTGDALNAVIQVTSIGVYVGALFLYNSALGQLALILVPVVAVTSVACSRRLRRIMQEGFPSEAKAQGLLVEQLRALETVKALGGEVAGRWRWEEAFRAALRTRLRVDKLRVLINAVSVGFEQLALTAMTYAAARMAVGGELSVGKVVAVGMFASSIFGPVRTLASQWASLQGVAVAFGRIDDVLTTSPEPDAARTGAARRLGGDLELRNVWFQYGSDLSPWVLKDVNLTIKRGETVAFVGRSGSGKTTLVQLLNLLHRPTRGQILIDGQDAATLPLSQIRDSIGIVMQDSNLFAGTVFDNISFGQDNASLDLVTAASRVANAHGFVTAMKDGYFTRLKEGGTGLSGGQRQRISLARALFRRPSILILDEATSALDAESERAVVNAMKVFCRGRTSILIAHRLSTILHASRIVLLDNGRVVETGTHRELIARGGAYAQLFGAQLAL